MELEVKYKIDVFPKQKLIDLGFHKRSDSYQIDKYYIVDKIFAGKRTYLRIREDKKKGIFSFDFHQIISELATVETEIKICTEDDCAKFDKILETLGHPLICIIDKQREVYEKEDIKVVFDTVQNLGIFIEIELEGDESEENISKLANTVKLLELKDDDIVSNKGYPDLMLETISTKI